MQQNLLKKIRAIMINKNISGYRLAKDSNLSRSYVYGILRGDINFAPKMSTLNELAKGLHIKKEDMYKLANLQYEDVSDDAYTNNRVPIMYYDRSTHEYLINGKVLDYDNFQLVKAMIDKLAK